MIKGSIQEKDITIINNYAPNIGAAQYIRQMLTTMKGEIDSITIIVGDFTTPLTLMDRSSKKKINKETQALNDTIDQEYHFPAKSGRIHFLLKCTRNILQDRSHLGSQIKPQKI